MFRLLLALVLATTCFTDVVLAQGDAAREKPVSATTPGSTSPTVTNSAPAPKVGPEYVIGPNDTLAISVWKEPELSRNVPVRPDGKISLPLVGEVAASGMTAPQLQAALRERLLKYLDNPEVTVIIEGVKSQQFNVVGQVGRPGTFDLTKPTTVLDALAAVGGLKDFAKEKKIYILRAMPDGSTARLPFNYKAVIKGKKVEDNIQLQPGDTIVVP